MQNYNVLEIEAIPQVAMAAMNDVHREELLIVNQISVAIAANDTDKISQLCQEWLAHTEAHFAKENAMMEKYNFPAYHCHHGEHVEALDGLTTIIKAWQENNDLQALSSYVRDSWPAWYVDHISTMDTITSAFIKQYVDNE
ncbi:MAG: hemerythrin [Methyloprofundus sp.]|nr:MAG: hemerythrin [Methyloprofundus sp.]